MNSTLSQDKSEFRVLVCSAFLKMFPDVYSFLDKMVQVLRDLRSKTSLLQDSENFASSDTLDLRNSMAISESNANLRWRRTLLCHFVNLLNEIV